MHRTCLIEQVKKMGGSNVQLVLTGGWVLQQDWRRTINDVLNEAGRARGVKDVALRESGCSMVWWMILTMRGW